MTSRIEQAREVSHSLLEVLEEGGAGIDSILMKAKRLARLMRDSDAQTWIDLEMRGYPENFAFDELGTCQKYAISGGRIDPGESKYYPQSLPALEANAESAEATIQSLRTARNPTAKAKDFVEKNATKSLIASQLKHQERQRQTYSQSKSLFSALKSSIHSYATDSYLALELGDVAEDIFEIARREVDQFVRSHAPKSAEKLIAISERMSEESAESRTAALTSCRRLLMDIADALFPATDEEWEDANGRKRSVGQEQYKNRLIAWFQQAHDRRSSSTILESQIEHIAARVDAVYEKACKGVHADVDEREARLTVIQTYLFLGEIAAQVNADDG